MKLVTYLLTAARKATVAFVTTAIATAVPQIPPALADGHLTTPEASQIIGSAIVFGLLAGFAVWTAPNKPAA